MSNDERSSNDLMTKGLAAFFVIRISSLFRASSFVIPLISQKNV